MAHVPISMYTHQFISDNCHIKWKSHIGIICKIDTSLHKRMTLCGLKQFTSIRLLQVVITLMVWWSSPESGFNKKMPGVLLAHQCISIFPVSLIGTSIYVYLKLDNSGIPELSQFDGVQRLHPSKLVQRSTTTWHCICLPIIWQIPSGW